MSFRRVVVGFDGSPHALNALRMADRLTADDGSMIVAGVGVLPTISGVVAGIEDASYVRTDALRALQGARDLLATRTGVRYEATAATGVAAGLHALAVDAHADLIVVGAGHHHGVGEVLLGSNAEATLHGAPCSVLVGPGGVAPAVRRVGVAFDGLPAGRRALRAAGTLAAEQHASLTVLAVLDAGHPYRTYGTVGGYGDPRPDARDLLSTEVAELHGIVTVDPRLEVGDPADRILALAREVDLLVLGSRSHGALLRLLLGSVSSTVVKHAGCAVVVIPDGELVPGTAPALTA